MSRSLLHFAAAVALLFAFAASAQAEIFFAYLEGRQEVPQSNSQARGYARVFLNEAAGTITYTVVFNNLGSSQTAAHIHAPAAIGANAPPSINLGQVGGTSGTITGTVAITAMQIRNLRDHLGYVNVHSGNFPGGEIRGQLGPRRPVDFDGDGRNDYSVLRYPIGPPSPIIYYNLNSTTGAQGIGPWGDAHLDYPAPGDYDGDGRDDLAVYRRGANLGEQSYFYVLRSSDNTPQSIAWGLRGDFPVARDYDGDGKTDPAVYRNGAASGTQAFWYIRQSSVNTDIAIPFGTTGNGTTTGDEPVPGDYDGDGKYDVAVYRRGALPPLNTFIIRNSSNATFTFRQWGNINTDWILPGDYDGDGKFDFCAARRGTSPNSPLVWYILQSSNNAVVIRQWGLTSDVPTQGDYDGDARTDISVYRLGSTVASQSFFYTLGSFDNAFIPVAWGLGSDFAVNSFDSR